MKPRPSTPYPAPTTWYGHFVTCATPGDDPAQPDADRQ